VRAAWVVALQPYESARERPVPESLPLGGSDGVDVAATEDDLASAL
jgi:hypothetical protein